MDPWTQVGELCIVSRIVPACTGDILLLWSFFSAVVSIDRRAEVVKHYIGATVVAHKVGKRRLTLLRPELYMHSLRIDVPLRGLR